MATYYVATDGSNDGNGSATSPWRTINKAMKAKLQPGDEVVVRSGTYKEAVTINKDGITLRSEVPGGAKIDASGTGKMGINVDANHVKVDGFEVFGSSKAGIGGSGAHHVEISNNISHDNATAGIYFRESEFVTIDGNVTYKNASSGPHSGISVHHPQNVTGDTETEGFRIIIRNNISYDNVTKTGAHTDGNGIILDDFRATKSADLPAYTYPSLVENNLVYHNGGEGIQVVWSDHVTVRNNTAFHNSLDLEADSTWRAELSNRQSSHNVWENNIAIADPAVHRHNAAINNISYDGYQNDDVVWHNNLTYNGTPGAASVKTIGGNAMPSEADGNKLGVDPGFVNLPFDLELLPGSPAIDDDVGAYHPGAADIYKGVSLHGDIGDNMLYGGAGNDKLHGYRGRDYLSGGDGSDQLRGGRGKDNLVGGDEGDVFVFRSVAQAGLGHARDVIRDFSDADGDKINLREIDADSKAAGNQAFALIGADGFSGKAGELQYLDGVVAGDVNGDRKADFQIEIANDRPLDAGDFLL
jgi:serralysin